MAKDGSQMTFRVARSSHARAGEEHFTTLSLEAVTELSAQMQAWAVSRLLRAASGQDDLPQAMRVTVRLTGEEERTLEPALDILWHRTWPREPDAPGVKPYTSEAMVALGDRMREWVLQQLADPARERLPQELQITVDAQIAEAPEQ